MYAVLYYQTSSYDSKTVFCVDPTNKTTATIHKKNCCDLILSFQNPRNTVYRKQLFHVTLSLCKLRSGRLICSFWIFQSWPCSKYHLISDCQSAITTLSAHNIALLLGIVPYRLSDILSRQSTRLYSLQSSCYVTASVIIDFWLEFQLQWSVSVCLLGLYLAEYRRVYVLLCFLFRFFFFFLVFFQAHMHKATGVKIKLSKNNDHDGYFFLIFTALHGMQTRSSDEKSIRLSVCQTRGLWQNRR